MTVGGAGLATQALAAGLVDELQLFLVPAIVGGGKPSQRVPGWIWTCWTRGGAPAAPSTSDTTPNRRESL
jgi:dihydrofolate reductase